MPTCEPQQLTAHLSPVGTPHGDRAFPRVGFFAKRDINRGEELGYRRDVNSISMRSKKANGGKKCECGAKGCCGSV